MPQPKVPDDDVTEDLPRDEGPLEEPSVEDDFDADQLAPEQVSPERERSWLGEDGIEGIDVPGEPLDALEGDGEGTLLDDSTLAIDDDPLELDPESSWTDGSEAEGSLFVGELLDDDEGSARADDGEEGLIEDDAPELDEAASAALGGDELADDLVVSEGEGALRISVLPFRDELTVGIASFEGELVQVTPHALYVGALPIPVALEAGESLAGAAALDDQHLLIWSSRGRAQMLAVFSQRALALDVVVHRAVSDGVGGAWIIGADGALAHLPSAPRAERLGRPRSLGNVKGAFDLASTRRKPDVLCVLARDGGALRLLSVRGGEAVELALGTPPTALTVDEDDRLLVAVGSRVARIAEATALEDRPPDDAAPITAMCTVDRTLVVLRDARASRHERP